MTKELPPFFIGQRVVAVKNGRHRIKNGVIYIINSLKRHSCGYWWVNVGDEEISPKGSGYMCECSCIMPSDGLHWCRSSLFAPITENFQHIEYSKILEKEKVLISKN